MNGHVTLSSPQLRWVKRVPAWPQRVDELRLARCLIGEIPVRPAVAGGQSQEQRAEPVDGAAQPFRAFLRADDERPILLYLCQSAPALEPQRVSNLRAA